MYALWTWEMRVTSLTKIHCDRFLRIYDMGIILSYSIKSLASVRVKGDESE